MKVVRWVVIPIMLLGLPWMGACSGCEDERSENATAQGGDMGARDAASDGLGSNNNRDASLDGGDPGDEGRAAQNNNPVDAGTDGTQNGLDASREDYCAGDGPPILQDGSCSGELAEVAFRFALCSCEGIVSSGSLSTSSIHSGAQMSGLSASIGSNGNVNIGGELDVMGSLWISSDNNVVFGQRAQIDGQLLSPATVTTQTLEVGRQARLGGLRAQGDVTLDELVLPDGEQPQIAGIQQIGMQSIGDVSLNDPCDCDQDLLIDVPKIAQAFGRTNDNDVIDLDPASTDNLQQETVLELPCGRFYLDRITGSAPLTIRVTGRTALFLGADLALSAPLTVELEEGAELDWFIAGNVVISGGLQLGSQDRPAAARLYVGGSGTINLSADTAISANIYAPRAELVLAAPTTLRGSAFIRRLATSQSLEIIYDEAILEAGERCEDPVDPTPTPDMGADMEQPVVDMRPDMDDPPQGCGSCRDCRNQACVDGQCGACTTASDCCAPLVCLQGRCAVIE